MEQFELKPGDQIGSYKVLAELGSGPMGAIYLGEHPFLDRRVEIKIVNRVDAEFRELFHQEAKILAGLRHPNIITLHDAGLHEGAAYLVMDVEEGHNLFQVAKDPQALALPVLLRIMAKIAGALQHAHEHAVVHKDITPGNIVLTPAGEPVLVDFGLSAPAPGEAGAPLGYIEGTPAYMAPEVARGEHAAVTSRADIWGFGATLFELVAGRPPFVGESVEQLLDQVRSSRPVDLSPLAGKAPAYVVDIIGKCLRKDPAERYRSAEELRRVLEATIDYMEKEPGGTEVMALPMTGRTVTLEVEYPDAEFPGAFRQYQVGPRVGGGRFGDVYRATELLSAREVALKVLKREWVSDEEAVARFRREGRVLSRLAHPNIVRVYNFGRYEPEHSFFMEMEFLSGPTLQKVMEERGPMDPKEALPTAIHVLHGLAALHREGIVHRDIKPENISAAGDRVVIFDFGLVRGANMPGITDEGMFLGTPRYAAPEQAARNTPTSASDVYSAGVILYEMLAGKRPHEDSSVGELLRRIKEEPPTPISKYRPDLPAPVLAALARMLEKDPARRPSAEEAAGLFANALAVS